MNFKVTSAVFKYDEDFTADRKYVDQIENL